MKIAILTSSRADYAGILPLLTELKKQKQISYSLIVFGTHPSSFHGNTINRIKEDGFRIDHVIESMVFGDTPESISTCIGLTTIKFATIWSKTNFDLILTTGDRYEMFAAALAAVPFNINIAHIHGGEDTEGAIDNVFRHSLSLMSKFHFTTTNQFKTRISNIKGSDKYIYNVGALSIDAMKATKLLTLPEFKTKFNIDLSKPSILITVHPETSILKENQKYIVEFINALKELKKYQLIITMPNADALGNMFRERLNVFIKITENAIGVESFGNVGYFTCMKHCKFMLGNSSSGFVEASYFLKYVINVGDRQKGRILTKNIVSCSFDKKSILKAIQQVEVSKPIVKIIEYGNGNTAKKIVDILKKLS
jgi:GDP/UDP-N,N'-diacetylbacillosamine 2-epimerase (hydrolysing)